MTIALICDVLGEANNGTVIATMNLIEHLKSRGHRVLVVSPDGTKAGIPDYFVAPTMSFGPLIDRAVQKNGVALAKPDKAMLRSVIEQADIVHLEMPFALARCAVKLARELNKPVTSSFHCQAENFTAHIGAMNSALVNHLVYKNFYRAVFSQCNAIHYPTDFIRQLFYQHTRCQVPAYVISNGVSDAFFSPAPKGETRENFTIVCTGRYSPEKAQAVLIRAVAGSKYRDNIELVLAGDGPLKGTLQRLARRKKVACECRFFPRQELIQALHSADLYVHTALMEIEAIACMEAIAAGLVAVICDSERSATRFFAVDERTLFRPNDPRDLRRKIEYFYENRDALQTYRERYAARSLSFGQQECMEQMEHMLLATAKSGRGDQPCGLKTKNMR